MSLDKTRVPHHLWCPVTADDVGPDEDLTRVCEVAGRLVVVVHDVDQLAEFGRVVAWAVVLHFIVDVSKFRYRRSERTYITTTTFQRVLVRLVSDLETDETVTENSLTVLCDSQTWVGGVVEGDAWI